MAEYVRVDINDAYIAGLLSDWSSMVGVYIWELTERAEDTAKVIAPVSAKGSKYAPPGFLKSRIAAAQQHAKNGTVLGLVGVPMHGGSRYPLPFINNPRGVTRNVNNTYRRAANKFLNEALLATLNGA